ncbi:MAG TPA: DUF2970 domain-containing protein [Thiotrichales bacterium]|nr:DUF2970 domain-containing protein [Thiotrichales bacterium]
MSQPTQNDNSAGNGAEQPAQAVSAKKEAGGITLFTFMGSLLAGWFGVQTKANRERDFEHGKFHHFIIGGIVFAVLFVLAVIGLVKVVLHFAMAT